MRGARRLRFLRQGAFPRYAEALARALPQFAAHARVAVDTEADSLHCYFEKLCLIQASRPRL
jgi:ribonuclease D